MSGSVAPDGRCVFTWPLPPPPPSSAATESGWELDEESPTSWRMGSLWPRFLIVLPARLFHFSDVKLLTLCWPCTTATWATSALSLKGHYLKIAFACVSLEGFFTFFIYLLSWKERAAAGATEGKKIPEISTANHVRSRFAAAVQMTALNYAGVFNWTAVARFLLTWASKKTLSRWLPEVTLVTNGGAQIPPAVPAAFPSPLLAAVGRTAASVALGVSKRLIPHTSVSPLVFFRTNCRETDALYQVTMFHRGCDFDLNMFLLFLLDETLCRRASDFMSGINLSSSSSLFELCVCFLAKKQEIFKHLSTQSTRN